MKKKVLIVSLSNIATDPRIIRQVETLLPAYEIHVVGYGIPIRGITRFYALVEHVGSKSMFKRKFVKIILLLFKRHKELYFYGSRTMLKEESQIRSQHFDLILANDFDSLPLIKYSINPKIRILLDAHEYFFDEINTRLRKRLYRPYREWIASTNMGQVVGMSTVSTGILDLYQSKFNLQDIALIRNIPKQDFLNFDKHESESIQIIHHGAAVAGRGIYELIQLMSLLDEKYYLNLMLVETDKKFLRELKAQAKNLGERVRFLSPVPTGDIVTRISDFDMGIHLIPPLSINNKFALPNKFFEFVQASLGIVVGPSPEMAQIVEKHSLGIVSESFDIVSVAQRMNQISRPHVENFRLNSNRVSKTYTWEEESKVLSSQVSNLMGTDHD